MSAVPWDGLSPRSQFGLLVAAGEGQHAAGVDVEGNLIAFVDSAQAVGVSLDHHRTLQAAVDQELHRSSEIGARDHLPAQSVDLLLRLHDLKVVRAPPNRDVTGERGVVHSSGGTDRLLTYGPTT